MPDISKINALAIGSVAKVDGLAKASILDIDGVAVPAGVAPPLDTYTNATGAYSVRLLRTLYTGPAMRVRRSGDDIEADVEFDSNNEISLTSPISNASSGTYTDLADFVDHSTTPRDAFCVEWKDQSGNGNDATQPTAGGSGLQPKVYDATTGLIAENGRAAVEFDGSNDFMATASSSWSDGEVHFSVVQSKAVAAGGDVWSCAHTSPFILRYASNNTTRFFLAYGLTPNQITISSGSTAQELATCEVDGGTMAYYVDGTSQGSQSYTGSMSTGSNFFHIGKRASANFFGGTIQEIIHWGTGRSADRTGIETNIDDFFQIPGM